MKVLCFRLLSKIIRNINTSIHYLFIITSDLNYTYFEWDVNFQSALNYNLKKAIIFILFNCNQLHYFNAWNIHKFSYRNDKTIESNVVLTLKCKNSIVRKLLGPLALKNIYCTYLILRYFLRKCFLRKVG